MRFSAASNCKHLWHHLMTLPWVAGGVGNDFAASVGRAGHAEVVGCGGRTGKQVADTLVGHSLEAHCLSEGASILKVHNWEEGHSHLEVPQEDDKQQRGPSGMKYSQVPFDDVVAPRDTLPSERG